MHVRFSLPFDQILTFAALAALSGIIGNLSYDIVKAVLKRIQKNIKAQAIDNDNSGRLEALINNPSEFYKFINYLSDYRDGLPNLNPMVEDAIFDEMSVQIRMAADKRIKEAIKQTTTDDMPYYIGT